MRLFLRVKSAQLAYVASAGIFQDTKFVGKEPMGDVGAQLLRSKRFN